MADKVDQDVREAAAELWRLLGEHPRAESILAGNHDQAQTVQILARMKEAGRQQGLREAAEAMRAAIARGYETPAIKGDKCAHDRFGWEDCICCYDDALEAAITALSQFLVGGLFVLAVLTVIMIWVSR